MTTASSMSMPNQLIVAVPDRPCIYPDRRSGKGLGKHHELRPLSRGPRGQFLDPVDRGVAVHHT